MTIIKVVSFCEVAVEVEEIFRFERRIFYSGVEYK